MKIKIWYFVAALALVAMGCNNNDDDPEPAPSLSIPSSYTSANFAANVTAEATVIDELSTVTSAANDAEANAQSSTVAAITYPSTLSSVTLPAYRSVVTTALVCVVNAANSPDGFQNPGIGGTPAAGQEGGLLGSRLLDENGLELEQIIEKGSFGAALYNHALTVINGDLSSSSAIDKLVKIHGTDASFDPAAASAAAKYSKRRSNNAAQTGFFWDIKFNCIKAKAAIEQGSEFNSDRDAALNAYLLSWEKSNYATVIYYCNSAKTKLQDAASLQPGTAKDEALGSAMHSYAEGVAFAFGFRGISRKMITDAQIDSILMKMLAPADQTPTSFRFLNEASLLANLDQVIDEIQAIYGWSEADVTSFYTNN